MASVDGGRNSEAARQQGNDFYREGQFDKAEKAYLEAAELAPEDPAPWSNISAIEFTQGNYAASLKSLDKALGLCSSEPDASPKKQKLYVRKAKCQLHLLSLPDAQGTVTALDDDEPSRELRSSVAELSHLWANVPDAFTLRKQIFDRLDRYKAQLLDAPSYFATGHDSAKSLFDDELKSSVSPSSNNLAFLMCGTGDARNLFVTIIDLCRWDRGSGGGLRRKFAKADFTIVDINPTALARTILLLDMVLRYAVMRTQNLPRIEDALTICAYVYSSPFVPPFVISKMTEHVRTLIDDLEGDYEQVTSIVLYVMYLPKETRTKILRVLKQWLEEDEAYTPKALRSIIPKARRETKDKADVAHGSDERISSTSFEQCRQDLDTLGVIFAPGPFIERREPEIAPLIADFRAGKPEARRSLEEHIDAHWKINPTVIDKDFERQKNLEERHEDQLPHLASDPLELYAAFVSPMGSVPGKTNGVIEDLSAVFDLLAISVLTIMDRIKIEMIAGEMTDVLERIRHDCLEHRHQKPRDPNSIDPTLFPRQYDRIHLSNIPDYIGGPLASHLYGLPLLRTDRASNLRFNNLVNPPMFETHDDFLAEYLLMHDAKKIEDHFGLVRKQEAPDPEREALAKMMGYGSFVAEGYFIWNRTGAGQIPPNRMMKQPALEHWLHAHLLKICVPHSRSYWDDRPVFAPLNVTTFFRLVERLYEVGYPAHWLSGVLAAICEGSITTTARAPWDFMTRPKHLSESHPARKISLGPWRAEYTTLLSLWRRILPFGVIAPGNALVPLEEIVKCSITVPEFPYNGGRVPHFTIAFLHDGLRKAEPRLDFPKVVQDDEKGDSSEEAAHFRDKKCHFVTSFKFVTSTRQATFWMRRDVVAEVVRDDNWLVGLCRTDVWQLISPSCELASKVLRQLGPWTA